MSSIFFSKLSFNVIFVPAAKHSTPPVPPEPVGGSPPPPPGIEPAPSIPAINFFIFLLFGFPLIKPIDLSSDKLYLGLYVPPLLVDALDSFSGGSLLQV